MNMSSPEAGNQDAPSASTSESDNANRQKAQGEDANRRKNQGWFGRLRLSRTSAPDSEPVGYFEQTEKKPEKSSLGVLNDRETEQVPGTSTKRLSPKLLRFRIFCPVNRQLHEIVPDINVLLPQARCFFSRLIATDL